MGTLNYSKCIRGYRDLKDSAQGRENGVFISLLPANRQTEKKKMIMMNNKKLRILRGPASEFVVPRKCSQALATYDRDPNNYAVPPCRKGQNVVTGTDFSFIKSSFDKLKPSGQYVAYNAVL